MLTVGAFDYTTFANSEGYDEPVLLGDKQAEIDSLQKMLALL